jgi:formylglycine-generating enzyme required for sulfatase activity
MRGNFRKRFFLFAAVLLLVSSCDKDWLPAWMRSDDDDDDKGTDVSGVEWVNVEGGTFQMGDTYGVGRTNEYPVHDVTLSSFQISKYEVTNDQFAAFLNAYGSDTVKTGEFQGKEIIHANAYGVRKSGSEWQAARGYSDNPVIDVPWYGAAEFCLFYGYRLPTEAEWEYAAKGGNKSQGYVYSGSDNPGDVAWYSANSRGTRSVSTNQPNEIGIHNMSGNAWEWCQDKMGEYTADPAVDPQGPSEGNDRILRGGSCRTSVDLCRTSYRYQSSPINSNETFGFRCAKSL